MKKAQARKEDIERESIWTMKKAQVRKEDTERESIKHGTNT